MEHVARTNSAQARTLLENLLGPGKGSKTEFLGVDVGTEDYKRLNNEGINAFLKLVEQGHGIEARQTASGQLLDHIDKGTPLSKREARQIISECTIHSTNRIALEKEALKHVAPGFHDEARQFVKQEAGRLDLPRDCVLTGEQQAKRVTPLLEELKALQQVGRRPLPTRDQMTQWAGFPEEDKRVLGVTVKRSEQYKAILAKLDQIRDARQPNASAVKAMALKQIAALGKGLRALEETLETYCETGSHGRNPQMKALLQQVQIERGWVDRAYTLYAPEGAAIPSGCTVSQLVDRTVPDQSQTGNASGPGGASKQDGVPPANEAAIYTRDDALVALGLEKGTVPSPPRSRRRTGSSPLKTIQTSSRLIWTTRKNRTT